MGFLSPSISFTRYLVQGKVEQPIFETVYRGLVKNRILDIDNETVESASGWTSFAYPYQPNFEQRSFIFDSYFIFSLRIDRKSISSRAVQKHMNVEMSKTISKTGNAYLSKNEKKLLRENVILQLATKTPATPNIYDVIWNIEKHELWFFSTLKSANEELETLFYRSFHVHLIV